MKREELELLHSLLKRLDAEPQSVPDDMLDQLAQACNSASHEMWGEREARMEGTSEFKPDPKINPE